MFELYCGNTEKRQAQQQREVAVVAQLTLFIAHGEFGIVSNPQAIRRTTASRRHACTSPTTIDVSLY